MDTGRISEQMQGGRLPEDCQVYSFNDGILHYSPIIYKRHAGSERVCIDPYTEGLAVDAPSALCRVFLVNSGDNLFNHGVERSVVNFVIPSSGDVRCSPLDEHHSYTKPTTHGKVSNQFAAY